MRRPPLLALLGLALLGCVSQAPPAGAPACTPAFPYEGGWLGGDSAFSVPLSGGRSLWLFGDTFVGRSGQATRRGAHFIHNSIGVSRCEAGRWSIEYHWSPGAEGPADFFDRPGELGWWWLFDGFVHGGDLYLGLLEVEPAQPRGPLALPFAFRGVELGRIANPEEPPAAWQMERRRLSRSSRALPASAMVVHEGYVYLFAFLDREASAHPRTLVRLPLDRLGPGDTDLEPFLETFTTDGSWQPGFRPLGAAIVMDDDATEMSVHFHAGLGAWLAIYAYPAAEEGDRVWVRTAPALEGPWSARRSLYRIPELDSRYVGGFVPGTACYAAKAHPQLSGDRTITLTYVCNLFAGPGGDVRSVLGRLADDLGLYRPIPVTLTLPPELSGE